ncbi:XRE family transcriptional regulator [bacterium 1XD21-13]|nr:XRE family transcriptional regulator [bacterium 1XD21-13]
MDEMPDVKMNTIGERMRFLRERVNLKQSAFAERVLVSGSYISKVETGEEIPSDIFTKLVAYEFNVPYNWLLKGEGYPFIFSESFFSDKANEMEKAEEQRYPKVGIRSKGKGGIFTEIYIDGHRIDGVRSYKLEQVAGQISRLTLDLNVINMAVDQEAILWSGLMDSEIAINVKTGSGERAFTFT